MPRPPRRRRRHCEASWPSRAPLLPVAANNTSRFWQSTSAAPGRRGTARARMRRSRLDHARRLRPCRRLRLRFAPSPTGPLHLGSAVVAVANALAARALGGELLLRIDDTDAERTAEGAEQGILDDLAWLGLEFAGAPIRQSERRDAHRRGGRRAAGDGARLPLLLPARRRSATTGAAARFPRADAERRHEAGEAERRPLPRAVRRGRRRRRDARAGALRRRGDLRLRARARGRAADVRPRDVRRRPRSRDHAHRARRGPPRQLGPSSPAAARAGRGRARLRALPDHRRRRRRAALDAPGRRAAGGAARGAACRPRPSSRSRRSSRAPRRAAPTRSAPFAELAQRFSLARLGRGTAHADPAHLAWIGREVLAAAAARGAGAPAAAVPARGHAGRRADGAGRGGARRVGARRDRRQCCHALAQRPGRHAARRARHSALFCELREADDARAPARTPRPSSSSTGCARSGRAAASSPRDVLHPLRIALTGAAARPAAPGRGRGAAA